MGAQGLYGHGSNHRTLAPPCQHDLAPPAPIREFCELSELAEVEAGNAQLKHDVEQLRRKLRIGLGASLEISHSHSTTLASTPSPQSARWRVIDSSSPNFDSPWTTYPEAIRTEVDVQNSTLKQEIDQMRERLEQQRLKQEINALRERMAVPRLQPSTAENPQLGRQRGSRLPAEPIASDNVKLAHC